MCLQAHSGREYFLAQGQVKEGLNFCNNAQLLKVRPLYVAVDLMEQRNLWCFLLFYLQRSPGNIWDPFSHPSFRNVDI